MYLFVYGVISSHLHSNPFYRSFTLIEDVAWVTGCLYDTGMGFPALAPGDAIVFGKLLQLDDDQFASMIQMVKHYDLLNSPFQFHVRPIKAVSARNQYHAVAFMYDDGLELTKVESGSWQ
ncbi:gamma-glutamylcyclotransferase [Paenibacillus xerothermodurans]|uniref:Uncharacterized protein n=1 Tax=Paenibacillus xerothermodurans TaxID=1977292 RepID=A0A2W1NCT1_PAEXE|nr:gamma-glutamylcyclotransferase [Paenibacillus xerothermodurans]PZE22307.1 hypothetical protein CBW46_000480 [Paenibacillus xerothermodurans]